MERKSPLNTFIPYLTLYNALLQLSNFATNHNDSNLTNQLANLIANLKAPSNQKTPDPHIPEIGSHIDKTYIVRDEHTAASLGHPDKSVQVLGSPQLGLWFETTSSILLPTTSESVSHVGVGLLLHHLAPAKIDDLVTIRSTLVYASGRFATFSCEAYVDEKMIGFGIHTRALIYK
jgi:fluoroacetyl-CoA thioesterase